MKQSKDPTLSLKTKLGRSCVLNKPAQKLLGDSPVLVYVEGRKIRLVPVGDDPVSMLTVGRFINLGTTLRAIGFSGDAKVVLRREADGVVFDVPEPGSNIGQDEP